MFLIKKIFFQQMVVISLKNLFGRQTNCLSDTKQVIFFNIFPEGKAVAVGGQYCSGKKQKPGYFHTRVFVIIAD
jgi:hypothetical protein